MLQVLLVIAGALIVLFGGMYIMSWIDKWLREDGFIKEEAAPAEKKKAGGRAEDRYEMLVFGSTREAEEICRCARESKLSAVFSDEVLFRKEWEDIRYIVAVSDSDLDNLLLCNIGKKLYNLQGAFGICSLKENRKLFKNSGIKIIEKREDMGEYILGLLGRRESLA